MFQGAKERAEEWRMSTFPLSAVSRCHVVIDGILFTSFAAVPTFWTESASVEIGVGSAECLSYTRLGFSDNTAITAVHSVSAGDAVPSALPTSLNSRRYPSKERERTSLCAYCS